MENRTWWWIGGGAVVLVIILFFVFGGGGGDGTTTTGNAAGSTTTTEAGTTTTGDVTTTTQASSTTTLRPDIGDWCEVTDTGGVDDRSFNQLAFQGAEEAAAQFGGEAKVLESQSETDYAPNIESFASSGECALLVTVGFLLGDATSEGAAAFPDQDFAIIDFAYDPTIPNVAGLVFAIDQAAFLAGYAAADQTQTGAVGTFGGINIPPVTDFMNGYALGVAYYNEQKGTDVEVIGWDPETQEGDFTGNFESLDDGRAFAENQFDEGADIILPVAGPVGLGAAAFAQETEGVRIIGVDADWTQTAPDFADVVLTSVLKNINVAVVAAAEAVVNDQFEGGVLVNTLETNGVGIAPITNPLTDDTSGLEAELMDVAAGIIDGSIPTS